MLRKEWKLNSICSTWLNQKVCITKEWKYSAILNKNNWPRLKRKKDGQEEERKWVIIKTIINASTKQISKEPITPSHSLIPSNKMMIQYTSRIPSHTHIPIWLNTYAKFNQSNLTMSQEIHYVELSLVTNVNT